MGKSKVPRFLWTTVYYGRFIVSLVNYLVTGLPVLIFICYCTTLSTCYVTYIMNINHLCDRTRNQPLIPQKLHLQAGQFTSFLVTSNQAWWT